MKFRQRQREKVHLDLTSLIDVVFLLVLFFVVTTSFNRESGMSVNLPQANPEAPKENPDDPVEVSIDEHGRFYVNRKEIVNTQLSTLKEAIRQQMGSRKDAPLIISADARTTHQSVVTAMDAARQLGIVHLSIATIEPKQPK